MLILEDIEPELEGEESRPLPIMNIPRATATRPEARAGAFGGFGNLQISELGAEGEAVVDAVAGEGPVADKLLNYGKDTIKKEGPGAVKALVSSDMFVGCGALSPNFGLYCDPLERYEFAAQKYLDRYKIPPPARVVPAIMAHAHPDSIVKDVINSPPTDSELLEAKRKAGVVGPSAAAPVAVNPNFERIKSQIMSLNPNDSGAIQRVLRDVSQSGLSESEKNQLRSLVATKGMAEKRAPDARAKAKIDAVIAKSGESTLAVTKTPIMAIVGAGIGFAVGGPIGAAVGAGLGLAVGQVK